MDSLCKDTFCTCTACHADINRSQLNLFQKLCDGSNQRKEFSHVCLWKKNREAQASVFLYIRGTYQSQKFSIGK